MTPALLVLGAVGLFLCAVRGYAARHDVLEYPRPDVRVRFRAVRTPSGAVRCRARVELRYWYGWRGLYATTLRDDVRGDPQARRLAVVGLVHAAAGTL
jgi:hypothetical protein